MAEKGTPSSGRDSICGLPHSVRDESLQMQCQHQICFGAQEQLESVTFLWKFFQNAFRLRFGQESCKTHSLGQEQSVVKLSYLYGHMYTINCTAPSLWPVQMQCQHQIAQICVGAQKQLKSMTFLGEVLSECIQTTFLDKKIAKNQFGSRTVSPETFPPLWARVHY